MGDKPTRLRMFLLDESKRTSSGRKNQTGHAPLETWRCENPSPGKKAPAYLLGDGLFRTEKGPKGKSSKGKPFSEDGGWRGLGVSCWFSVGNDRSGCWE